MDDLDKAFSSLMRSAPKWAMRHGSGYFIDFWCDGDEAEFERVLMVSRRFRSLLKAL